MAKISIQFVCGCGYRSTNPEEAGEHSDNRHHEMSISGYIKPTTTRAKNGYGAQQAQTKPVKAKPSEVKVSLSEFQDMHNIQDSRKDFDSIRARLRK